MKHVIDIQDYGGNRVARLLPTFRVRFDENHVHVCHYLSSLFDNNNYYFYLRLNSNNHIVSYIVQKILLLIPILIYHLFKYHSAYLLIMFVNY